MNAVSRVSVILLGLLTVFVTSANGQSSRDLTATPELTRFEQNIVTQINIIRMRNGLKPLRQNAALQRAARAHSKNMAENNFFNHEDAEGRSVADRTKAERYDWQSVGENIAMNSGYKEPVMAAIEGWMKSPGHRENILRPNYTETGVGLARIGNKYYFTQVFGRPF